MWRFSNPAARGKGGIGREQSLEIMRGHLSRLEKKRAEIEAPADYLRTKIAWQESGGRGAPPTL